ncbi:MAG: VCBS repeat-containing protein, partial [Phycisphaerales bacterium]|nr:VCBS repeat-containing protein [Phycisphaerales bacterium]
MNRLASTLAAASCCTAFSDTNYFDPPVPLRANGEIINVTTGHAAPCIYDFDGDGIRDLLVGEFGDQSFKGETTQKAGAGHPWVAGKLRFYRNHGTDLAPIYKDYAYVQAGGQDAQVPITCWVSFVPQFIDFNADGHDDIVTGSYPGDIYFFPGNSENGFDAPILQRNVDGGPVHAQMKHRGEYHDVHSVTAELHDMDADQDLDMVIGSRLNGCFVIENIGNANEPKWAPRSERLETEDGKNIGGWEYGSNVHFTDWDGDGRSDILVGSEDGGIFWHRNLGNENEPIFGDMKTLIPEQSLDQRFLMLETPMRPSSRVKVHVVDYDGDGMKDMLVGDFGSKWSRQRTLSAQEKIKRKQLEEKLDSLYEESQEGAEALSNNKEREAYFDEFSKKIDPVHEELNKYETHRDSSTGYVWYYRQISAPELDSKEQTTDANIDSNQGKPSTVKLLSHGATLDPRTSFPVTITISVPEGWAACGNKEAMDAAKAQGLPTVIEWDLPTGCTISSESWQDADENALYDELFAIEAIIDTADIDSVGSSVIAADVSYQRCDKKSGVCILEK